MKIVCINNSGLNGTTELTINKTYETIEASKDQASPDQYYIKDNSGEKRWYNDYRFKDIATIRKEKLNQIGI
jgi:hypothetical protein